MIRVSLRDTKREDLDDYRRWFSTELEWTNWDAPWEKLDEEFAENFISRIERSIDREPPAVRKRFEIECDGIHIGWVSAYKMDGERLAIGIDIPEKEFWGRGFGKEAMQLFLDYLDRNGFDTIYCQTWSGNSRMVRLALSLGFKIIDNSQTVCINGIIYERLNFRRKETNMDITIREETRADFDAITSVTIAAFTDHPVSRQTEHFIIRELRKADAMLLSLVAEVEDKIVGHIAFSPVEISDGTNGWVGLGPVSVLPDFQNQGIGRALIKIGIALLSKSGIKGIALVGDPNYYSQYGFKNYPQLIHEGIPQEYFLVLPVTEDIPQGNVTFHKAYFAEE